MSTSLHADLYESVHGSIVGYEEGVKSLLVLHRDLGLKAEMLTPIRSSDFDHSMKRTVKVLSAGLLCEAASKNQGRVLRTSY